MKSSGDTIIAHVVDRRKSLGREEVYMVETGLCLIFTTFHSNAPSSYHTLECHDPIPSKDTKNVG